MLCASDVLPLAAMWAAVCDVVCVSPRRPVWRSSPDSGCGVAGGRAQRIGTAPVHHRVGRGHGVDCGRGFPGGRAGLGTLCRDGRGCAGSKRDGARDARGRPAWPGCAGVRVFCVSGFDIGDVAWFSVGLVDAGISLVRAGRGCAGRQCGRRCGAAQVGGRLRTAGRGVLAGTRAGPGLGAGLRRPDVAAQTHAVRAAQIARQSGMYAVEMRALHTAVRFDDRSQTERLAELAKTLNTPLAEAIARARSRPGRPRRRCARRRGRPVRRHGRGGARRRRGSPGGARTRAHRPAAARK